MFSFIGTGRACAAVALVLLVVGAGCRTAPDPSSAGGNPAPCRPLSAAETDLAAALANYAMGILRDGMADSGSVVNYERSLRLSPERLDLSLRVAAARLRLGDTAAAVATLKEACRRHPRSAEARIYLAQIHQLLKDWDEARAAWREVIRLAPGDGAGYLQLALMDYEQGDAEGPFVLLEAALAKVDDQRPVLRLLGDLHVQQAGDVVDGQMTPDIRQALEYYRRAARLPADELTLPYLMQQGDLYLLTRQIESAVDCFAAVVAKEPDNLAARKKLALCYLAQGDHAQAIACLKVIADHEPLNSDIQYCLGEEYENIADTTNAVVRFTSACDGKPSTSKLFLKLALYYMPSDPQKAGQVLKAGLKKLPDDRLLLESLAQLHLVNRQENDAKATLRRLQEVVAKNPDRPLAARLLTHYGLVAQQYGLKENAEAMFQRSMELDPSLVDAYVRLALLYANQDRQTLAAQVMEKAQHMIPDNFTLNYVSGVLFGRLQRYPDAREAFERAWDIAMANPADAHKLDSGFYFSFGSVCERAGQFAEAESLLQCAMCLDSDNVEAFNYLAYMWAERGVKLAQARALISHALDEDPEDGAFTDTLGWIYFKQGRLEEALAEIGNALVFMPDDPMIMEHLGDVLAALRRAPEARHWWEESYRRNPDNAALGDKLKTLCGHGETAPIAAPPAADSKSGCWTPHREAPAPASLPSRRE